MRRAVLVVAGAGLLLGPTVLAFFQGGYFDGPRLVAAALAWLLVLAMALASPRPLPSSPPGWAALAGLVLITVWTAVSFAWAPLAAAATDNLTRLLLYLGVVVAALGLLHDRGAVRAVEPTLALGTLVVIGYGLSGRLLPEAIDLLRSWRGGGRLEQPITYWNAEGALAAMGLVLCARLAGDRSRPVWLRGLAAAATAPLGLGIYLSYSRGAIAAGAIGLLVIVAATRSRSQLQAAGIALAASVAAAVCSAWFPGVASLEGTLSERASDGAFVLTVLVTIMFVAALLQTRMAVRERRYGVRPIGQFAIRRLPALAVAVLVLALAGLVTSGLAERTSAERPSEVKGAARLTSVDSRRYDYWRVGTDALANDPLRGIGSGGFRVVWLKERPVSDYVLEVHSLPLEMAVELGLPGLLGFGLFLGGIGVAARRALQAAPEVAAGPTAVFAVWFLHATIDWDWQVPAVTLVALVAAAAVVGTSEAEPDVIQPLDEDAGERSSRERAPAIAPT